ncbi:type II toxin-antitoxin system RelE/ParE family toxin [Rhodococcus sp. ZPP]|uniref:type II toxin-antitoxin system RelE/ParE family toxin n=1 Tax=Rhodococcus sp. ZPP TaxID=2749906 RepID=UPI001AD87343|nr:type II toxin-antitoxin system RelE/ParE family toxin [Rhodococcus sp. ZPP]QTJ68454.1 type II toxin-antitoxin system RelE/ParE family toxin [Rhodococcus sp. ZPP]
MFNVELLKEVEEWFIELASTDPEAAEHVAGAIDLLEATGPTLGRPVVDKVKASRFHSMKELRPPGTHIRILFIFDPHRDAVLLVGGDKTGQWRAWYAENIPVADDRYQKRLDGDYDD